MPGFTGRKEFLALTCKPKLAFHCDWKQIYHLVFLGESLEENTRIMLLPDNINI